MNTLAELKETVPNAALCIMDLLETDYDSLETGKFYYVQSYRKWSIVKIISPVTDDNFEAEPVKVLNRARTEWIEPKEKTPFTVEDFYIEGRKYVFYTPETYNNVNGGRRQTPKSNKRKTLKRKPRF